jgi:hypothetical protein
MNFPAPFHCTFEKGFQLVRRCGFCHSVLEAQLAQRRLGASEDNVFKGLIITENGFPIVVDVDNGRQPGQIETPEIQKRTVLSETIVIVRIIDGTLIIAEKQEYPGFKIFLQLLASLNVNIGWKHFHR